MSDFTRLKGTEDIFGAEALRFEAIESAARQPEALPLVQRLMFIGFALVEAQVLYALLITFILVFIPRVPRRRGLVPPQRS